MLHSPFCADQRRVPSQAALRAAVAERRDLRKGKLGKEARADALHAAREAHEASLSKGSRAVRGAGGGAQSRADVSAYYRALAAAAALLRRAHPPASRPRRAAAAEEEDEDEDEADIERERKRNIRRNQAELVKLGLA